jgi:hypothetical protein
MSTAAPATIHPEPFFFAEPPGALLGALGFSFVGV